MLDSANQKNELVVMHNNLIRGKYNYGLADLRFILTLISMIKPEDTEFQEYQLSAKQFSDLLDSKFKDEYSRIKKFGIELSSRILVLEDQEKSEFKIRNWFRKFDYSKGVITCAFNEDLKPYLLQLTKSFTSFSLGACLHMRSKYGMVVYMLAKSWEGRGQFDISVDDFKELLGITGKAYDRYNNLRAKVIDKALAEINNTGDIFVSVGEEKTGKKITKLHFTILRGSDNGVMENLSVAPKPRKRKSKADEVIDESLIVADARRVVDYLIEKRRVTQPDFDILISSNGRDPYAAMKAHLETGMRTADQYMEMIRWIFESTSKDAYYWRNMIFTIPNLITKYSEVERAATINPESSVLQQELSSLAITLREEGCSEDEIRSEIQKMVDMHYSQNKGRKGNIGEQLTFMDVGRSEKPWERENREKREAGSRLADQISQATNGGNIFTLLEQMHENPEDCFNILKVFN